MFVLIKTDTLIISLLLLEKLIRDFYFVFFGFSGFGKIFLRLLFKLRLNLGLKILRRQTNPSLFQPGFNF